MRLGEQVKPAKPVIAKVEAMHPRLGDSDLENSQDLLVRLVQESLRFTVGLASKPTLVRAV